MNITKLTIGNRTYNNARYIPKQRIAKLIKNKLNTDNNTLNNGTEYLINSVKRNGLSEISSPILDRHIDYSNLF